jgi:ketosteroid isomerase-like protein
MLMTIKNAAPIALASVLYAATISFSGASDRPASEILEQRNKETVAAAFGRWAAGGTGFFEEILAPDVAWTIPGSSPVAGTYTSRNDFIARAVRPFARRLAGPIKPTVRNVWADGDHVIVHWDGAGTAGDGQPYNNSYAWIFRMKDGKATEVTAFLDLVPYDEVLRRVPLPE